MKTTRVSQISQITNIYKTTRIEMVEVSLTVGKLDASLALLLTKDHHLIEFPTILLPDGVNAGSVVTIKCEQDIEEEKKEAAEFEAVQDKILELFGTHEPIAPVLKIRNVTQTSAVLEWDPLNLGSSTLKSLTLYKNGSRLGQIPNPLVNKNTKLSGLPIDTEYQFYLRLDTTAGSYKSNTIKFTTHKMTDLTGISVCLGEIDPSEGITAEEIERSLTNIGAKPLHYEVKVDTTHFITTVGQGAQWKKAVDNNIPVVRPEWLKACETERRIVGVRNFYLDADPKFLENNKYSKETTPRPDEAASSATPVQTEQNGNTSDAPVAAERTPTDLEDVAIEEKKDDTSEPAEPEPAQVIDEPVPETTTEDLAVEATPEEPVAGESAVNGESVAEEPDVEAPVVEEPVVEEPAVEEPAVEEPVVDSVTETTPEEPVVEEPVTTETPVKEDPVAEETIGQEPVVKAAEVDETTEKPSPVVEPVQEEVEAVKEETEPTEAVKLEVEEPNTTVQTTESSKSLEETDNLEDVDLNEDEEPKQEEITTNATTTSSKNKKKKNNKKKNGKK